MDLTEGLLLGAVQGITEFLPVSSSGHLILARELFGYQGAHGLAVDALLQLATALAVVVYFRADLIRLALAFVSMITSFTGTRIESSTNDRDRILIGALVVGTLPAVVFGLLLESYMETVFRSAALVALMLVIGSLVFIAAEYTASRYSERGLGREITVVRGFIVGLFQCLALIPGMSRSGMTISGGLLLGFSREEAARFGFLLSIPIILGSGLKKALELGSEGLLSSMGWGLAVSFATSFVIGMLVIHYLLKYLRNHTLYVFVAYRLLLALVIASVLYLG